MHGLPNDYLLIESGSRLASPLVVLRCLSPFLQKQCVHVLAQNSSFSVAGEIGIVITKASTRKLSVVDPGPTGSRHGLV